MIELTGSNLTIVVVVAVIALAALGVAAVLVREVLAADEGTERMQEIAGAVQEGASAYLTRQFRTLAIFAVVVFFLLFLLPAETTQRAIGRSHLLHRRRGLLGVTGYVGMWLAVRGNVRVAAAARDGGEQTAMKIAFRTGGVAGMFTVGLGLLGAASSCSSTRATHPGPRGLRLRCRAARHVHACRRRHLHQGRRRRRRPRRQGRAGHPRGRPAQRRDHRRQRRRQRRRLRRHGGRPLRVLRRHPRRRADPGQGGLRRDRPGLPADRPGHRRHHRGHRHLRRRPRAPATARA